MKKGRDSLLIEARDRRLFERYYYWTEVQRLRIDDTIRKLSKEEFFISESRVMHILREMILSGAEVDGHQIEKPLFSGFRVSNPSSPQKRKASASALKELQLFP